MSGNIIDHVEIPVAEPQRSRRFYEAALEPLGLSLVISIDPARTRHGGERHGFGKDGYPRLWIHGEQGERLPVHVAFAANERAKVDAFYAAAIAKGGTDNGAPGIRDKYHPDYYAAYVLDPDGNNIEVVCQDLMRQ